MWRIRYHSTRFKNIKYYENDREDQNLLREQNVLNQMAELTTYFPGSRWREPKNQSHAVLSKSDSLPPLEVQKPQFWLVFRKDWPIEVERSGVMLDAFLIGRNPRVSQAFTNGFVPLETVFPRQNQSLRSWSTVFQSFRWHFLPQCAWSKLFSMKA